MLHSIQSLTILRASLPVESFRNIRSLSVTWSFKLRQLYGYRQASTYQDFLLRDGPYAIYSWDAFCAEVQRMHNLRVLLINCQTNWDFQVGHGPPTNFKRHAQREWLYLLSFVTHVTERFDVWLHRTGPLKSGPQAGAPDVRWERWRKIIEKARYRVGVWDYEKEVYFVLHYRDWEDIPMKGPP